MSKTANGNNNKELSNNKYDDNSNSITTYSLGNKEDVEKVFKRFDLNGDGMISITEFSDVLRALGSTPSADELKRIMTELDTDGDGFIDFKEFANFHRGGSDEGEEVTNRELRDAFDLYDRDKNGVISARELHAVLKSLGDKCSLKDCSRMISSFDVDGDGCVNFEEFKNMMKPKPKAKPIVD